MPRLLDLFCGAGGAAMGYHRAGFDLVGVDIKPQPRYPFEFYQADALEFCAAHGHEFDAIHASPPCQAYAMTPRNLGTAHRHPRLLEPVVAFLRAFGLPYAIENVPKTPMRPDVVLCGSMFGLEVRRHRWFELSVAVGDLLPGCRHLGIPIGVYGRGTNKWHREKLGRDTSKDDWRRAMGIDWMQTRPELANSIPPAYTEFIGKQLLRAIGKEPAHALR
jgi:site-specific DNA-cytosine methylase